eukprot:TRINITY_DN27544_c0_g1_i1.p1 TRINITY_DN27544_c0_g1~~TRINITY_DN27544_c0_g1_i1.p1  ORF type:complete len:448 (-),score=92.50 TRINITY_DN27544_c0_g1_i1:56-1219(-)
MYDPQSNPEGYINLSVAENKLIFEPLRPRLETLDRIPEDYAHYGDFTGRAAFKEALGNFLERHVFRRPVNPAGICMGAGAGPVMEFLAMALMDPGEGIIIPTPYYPGFDIDHVWRPQCKVIPAHMSSAEKFDLDLSILEKTRKEAEDGGTRVKAIMLCSPSNPLGRTWPKEKLRQVLAWAHSYKIHAIVTEVYAVSCFGTEHNSSADILDDPEARPYTHLLWSFSKDFGLSGFRMAMIYTENPELQAAFGNMVYFFGASAYLMHAITGILKDREFVDNFVLKVKRTLKDAYTYTADVLNEFGFKFLPADSGFFVLVDMREFLEENSWEGERKLWLSLLQGAKVNFTPGAACHCVEPGWMRVCFASLTPEALRLGLLRAHKHLSQAKK